MKPEDNLIIDNRVSEAIYKNAKRERISKRFAKLLFVLLILQLTSLTAKYLLNLEIGNLKIYAILTSALFIFSISLQAASYFKKLRLLQLLRSIRGI